MGSASSREEGRPRPGHAQGQGRPGPSGQQQQQSGAAPPTYQPFPSPPPYAGQQAAHYPPPQYLTQQPGAYQYYPQAQGPQGSPYPQARYQPPPQQQGPAQQGGPLPGQYGQPRPPMPTQEYQTTATIRNQVNLKKQTLKLEATSNPQVLTITFRFDASAACRVTTFVVAREDTKRNCLITAQAQPGPAVRFDKGLDHKFPPADNAAASSAHVLNLARINPRDLTNTANDSFPLIIRLEALTDKGRAEGQTLDNLEVGCSLPSWVQSQTTYAKVVKEDDGSWGVRVLKQKIWVEGTAYELQEIYGMENNKAQMGSDGFEDMDGNDCVICMSAARDTTALPCRHMCMCHGCASALKAQTNKCPICRNEIESLLHIKINKAPGPSS